VTFLHPAMLAAGLACVSLPIIIHLLFRRRRKPVRWGAMQFLLEAYRRQRRRLRLEQVLLLAARCLLIALIALGLGRPLLQRAGLLGGGAVTLYVLVDNSIASGATGDDGRTALERHKRVGARLLGALDPSRGDRAALIALGAPAEPVVLPSSAETEAVSRALDQIEQTAGAMDLDGAFTRLAGELEARERTDGSVRIVVLSDFLAGSAETDQTLASLGAADDVALIASRPADQGVDNVGVASLEPLRPVLVAGEDDVVKQQQVRVRLRRSGPGIAGEATTRVQILQERAGVEGGAAVVGEETVTWSPGRQALEVPVSISVVGSDPSGVLAARITRDALETDDLFRRPIQVRPRLRVGIAARRSLGVSADSVPIDAAGWIDMALAPEGADARGDIEVARIEPAALDAGRLAGLDALFLVDPDAIDPQGWSRLADFAEAGGLVVVFPPATLTTHAWTDRLLGAFDLDWSVEREVVDVDEGLAIGQERGPFGAATDVLHLVAGELEALASPVTVFRYLPVRAAPEDGAAILTLENGSPLVIASAPGAASRGLVVMFATAPSFNWTDLPARPLIVPLMQEIVRQGRGEALGPTWGVAGRPVAAPARSSVLVSIAEGRSGRVPVSAQGTTAEPIRRAGLWRAEDDRAVDRGLVAVNADVDAAVTDAQSPGEISAWLASAAPQSTVTWLETGTEGGDEVDVAGTIRAADDSGSLAAKLIVAAIVIGLLELAMSKLFSHARTESGKGALA